MSFLRRVFGSRPAAREVFARGPHAQLMRECERTSEEVIAYLEARARKEPSPEPRTPNNDAWHEAQNNYARYMMDTMTEYRKRFESRLAGVRDALAALDVTDPDFDQLVAHAGNPMGARKAADRLLWLARRLDPEVAALEKVYASDRAADAE